MKKARTWLDEHSVEYEFHNYKKQGVPEQALGNWVDQLGWEVLLNKRGTTWRQLDEDTKANVDTESAIQIMLDNPSIIKRPVLDVDGEFQVGFSDKNYQQVFG